jgi:hypothetical protein
MYEVDFTGWTRTPEAIQELKSKSWKRRKFHWRRFWLSIKYRRDWRQSLKDFLTNSKNI